jgi:putative oxidoreductase
MTSSGNEKHRSESRTHASWVPSPIYHIFRVLVGIIFILASLDKIESPANFGRAIYAYKFLTGPFAYLITPIAVLLPWAELISGFLLLINRLVRPAALLILAMNIMFMVAIASAIIRGIDVECGCGLDIGFLAQIAGTQADVKALVRDILIVAMNLVVLMAPQSATK